MSDDQDQERHKAELASLQKRHDLALDVIAVSEQRLKMILEGITKARHLIHITVDSGYTLTLIDQMFKALLLFQTPTLDDIKRSDLDRTDQGK